MKLMILALLALAIIALSRALLEGSIFARRREKAKAKGGHLGDLFHCPLCMTMEVAIVLSPLVWLAGWPGVVGELSVAALTALAAAALAQFYWDGRRPLS